MPVCSHVHLSLKTGPLLRLPFLPERHSHESLETHQVMYYTSLLSALPRSRSILYVLEQILNVEPTAHQALEKATRVDNIFKENQYIPMPLRFYTK